MSKYILKNILKYVKQICQTILCQMVLMSKYVLKNMLKYVNQIWKTILSQVVFMSKYVLKNMLKYAKQICKSGGFGVKICFKNMLNKYVNQVVLMHCQRITLDVCLLSGSPKSKYPNIPSTPHPFHSMHIFELCSGSNVFKHSCQNQTIFINYNYRWKFASTRFHLYFIL